MGQTVDPVAASLGQRSSVTPMIRRVAKDQDVPLIDFCTPLKKRLDLLPDQGRHLDNSDAFDKPLGAPAAHA